jgi:hypothetical protein
MKYWLSNQQLYCDSFQFHLERVVFVIDFGATLIPLKLAGNGEILVLVGGLDKS